MGERLSTVIILVFLIILQACGQAATGGNSCPEHQQSFQSSCYEFVGLQRSFHSAQAWCEWGGGHLAFIRDDETQQFLQKHMQPEQNWWIGLAPSFDYITLDTKGGINWLDGSDVIYSNWISKPVLETGCGYISTDSNSQWKMTRDCDSEFSFMCEFELGRSLSCMNHSTFLKCDSDQVIEIQRSFYGRRTPHYCRNDISTSHTSSQDQCSWDSVLDLVSGKKKDGSLLSGSFTIPLNLPYHQSGSSGSLQTITSTLLIIMNVNNVTELRKQLLSNICVALTNSSLIEQGRDVLMVANAMKNLVEQEDEVNSGAQVEGGCIVESISYSLASIDLNTANMSELRDAAQLIVESASHILKASKSEKESNIASYLVNGLDAVQSFMLANKTPDMEPAIITAPHISIYANRLSPQYIKQAFTIPDVNVTSATFSLPDLSSNALANIIEPVDVRMTNFLIDPWRGGLTLNSHVCGFSLTTPDGQSLPVEDLPLEIEILIPRPKSDLNSTVLDLSSYSTMAINITSQNATLVLKLQPSEELPLVLLLGYQDYPSDSNYVAKVTFPLEANSLVERYTWILKPSELAGDEGLYYLLVRPIVGPGVKSVNASLTVTSITAQCIFWQQDKTEWSDSNCRVGPNTTASVTQCLCNHLTFFGSSFFVMPNTVDPSKSAELFSNFAQNPVVVCFIGAIFLAYILVAIWARRKDLQDKVKVKVTVLEDNDPFAEYRYLLKISTGHRIGASPSSRVVVMIQGTEGVCEPHHLTDPEKTVFERGAVDLFLLTTPYSLGELESISLWHDNSGDHPAWYVNSVMVQDMETGEKRHFLCSAWLAADIDECTIERTFPVATDADLKGFTNLFFMKTTTDFCDGHIWYSVVSRPPSSNFTRVQRVSCCFSVLLCTMLTSIMFYGIPTDPSDQTMDMGHIELTWSQVMIGIQSSFIVFPVNLLIVGIFRQSRPREKKTKRKERKKSKSQKTEKEKPFSSYLDQNNITAEFLIKDIQRIIYLFANAMRCSVPNLEKNPEKADINMLLSELHELIEQQHSTHANDPSSVYWIYTHHLLKQLQNMEGEVRLLGPSGFSRPGSYSQVLLQVQNIKRLLEGHIYAGSFDQHPPTSGSTKDKKKSCWNGFPWWFVYVGWLLVAGTSVVSGYFTMLYGLKYGKDRSINWIISIAMSFTESLFFTQPVKVICFAIFFALVVKNINSDDDLVDSLCKKKATHSEGPDGLRLAKRDCMRSYYKPPPPSDIEKIKRNLAKQRKARGLIVEILVYLGFLWMLLVVAYGQRDSNAYYLTQHIRLSFEQGISDSMNYNDVFKWANNVILNNLFGEYPGFITDGNSKCVGTARLRQIRVKRDSCKIAKPMRDSVPDCNAPYSWDDEDMGSYDLDWQEPNSANGSVDTIWSYQSQSTLRGYPVWGDIALYRGGGYVVDLGADKENASSKLQYLFDSTWLDTFTRAIFVEFTVYNANVNLFCLVTLMLERTAVGAFQYRGVIQSVRVYQSTGGFQSFLIASQVFYFLFVCYYMFVQGKLLKKQKWAYFKNKWNLLDLFIIILSWTTLSAIIKRTVLGDRDITYYQNNKDQFPSFQDTALADATLGYLLAFLVLLASVKLWHLLRLNPKLHLITASLQRAWKDISNFIMVIAIVFVAYSLACNLIFGWKLYSYRSFLDAFKTIFNLQFGLFNYDEVMDSNPVLGALIITSCVIFLTFVILTLFVSVILEAFSEEQENHQPSEEQEYVDLIITKFLGLFGIKCKKKEDDKECLLTDDTN
ncbi:Polycystic kidney disease protein 1-like 2 PC1-like 2 protein [Triplophysa tibetana]|uniref:Polycystic kidney disease protein 1-like 2 PC1-like 2 protein n=1 Tax=Triplophysa tibetana TaxID=1572043 RepID=A0A5A9PQE3_9TELE|nr:Polycystic kidney disease protein 1-like 2 PC1-like 2 protein [Triplophysa tibetana]